MHAARGDRGRLRSTSHAITRYLPTDGPARPAADHELSAAGDVPPASGRGRGHLYGQSSSSFRDLFLRAHAEVSDLIVWAMFGDEQGGFGTKDQGYGHVRMREGQGVEVVDLRKK